MSPKAISIAHVWNALFTFCWLSFVAEDDEVINQQCFMKMILKNISGWYYSIRCHFDHLHVAIRLTYASNKDCKPAVLIVSAVFMHDFCF